MRFRDYNLLESGIKMKGMNGLLDTDEVSVLECTTKETVKNANEFKFNDEDYMPYKYGTRAYFITIKQGEFKGEWRANLETPQLVTTGKTEYQFPKIRELFDAHPTLYPAFKDLAAKHKQALLMAPQDMTVDVVKAAFTKSRDNIGTFFSKFFNKHSRNVSKEVQEYLLSQLDHGAPLLGRSMSAIRIFDRDILVDWLLKGEPEKRMAALWNSIGNGSQYAGNELAKYIGEDKHETLRLVRGALAVDRCDTKNLIYSGAAMHLPDILSDDELAQVIVRSKSEYGGVDNLVEWACNYLDISKVSQGLMNALITRDPGLSKHFDLTPAQLEKVRFAALAKFRQKHKGGA